MPATERESVRGQSNKHSMQNTYFTNARLLMLSVLLAGGMKPVFAAPDASVNKVSKSTINRSKPLRVLLRTQMVILSLAPL